MAVMALAQAHVLIASGVVRVQQDFPEELAHGAQLGFAVAQRVAEMVVAVDHSLAEYVLNVQVVRHGSHHVGPKALAVQQGQLDLFAAGDIADAENNGIEVAT
ncbi:hypothetical protein ALQ55_200104 [Pseudomonas savastanoi pv. savastanoi]|nr:hypothetical protein ALQ55_200104 [Pseudomonas savastanoi pv. savastanoi]